MSQVIIHCQPILLDDVLTNQLNCEWSYTKGKEEYALLNDIIIDYCDMIDDNKFNNLEDVVNSELQSIL